MTVDVTETISQTVHPAFQLLRQHHVEALDILVSEYKHKVTGAVHYHLATDYDENVFLVAFRTQPMDSKGTAHILEHTALCGSEKFPVRDPFFLMIRRSLNTFMNAFTAQIGLHIHLQLKIRKISKTYYLFILMLLSRQI